MDNKIYLTPESSILLDNISIKPPRQRSEDQPKLNPLKVPQRSRQISITKELDYYVKQEMKHKMLEKQKLLSQELECFKRQYKDVLDNPYVNNKLKKNYFNLKFSDEQRETYAIRLGRVAMKHKQQIQQMQKIQEDIHIKYQMHTQELNTYNPKIETLNTLSDNDSYIKSGKVYNPDLVARYQKVKYQHFWNKIPKTLAD